MVNNSNFIQTVLALRGVFAEAGIPCSVREIENRYWPDSSEYDNVRSPWLKVYTERGVIVVGWRKRVIHIDWSDGTFTATGAEVVARPINTHGDAFCHAWGYAEAIECLRRLWEKK